MASQPPRLEVVGADEIEALAVWSIGVDGDDRNSGGNGFIDLRPHQLRIGDGYQDPGGFSGHCRAEFVHFNGWSEGIRTPHVFRDAVLRCGAGESGVGGLPIRQTDVGGDEKVLLRFAMALASSNKDGKSRGQYHQENTLFQHFHNHLQRSRGPNSTPKT